MPLWQTVMPDRSRESLQMTYWMSVQTITGEQEICGSINSTELNSLQVLNTIFCTCTRHQLL